MNCTGFLWDKTSVRARVCEKHVAKVREKTVKLNFNLLRQESHSSGCFIITSTAVVLHCVLYNPVP